MAGQVNSLVVRPLTPEDATVAANLVARFHGRSVSAEEMSLILSTRSTLLWAALENGLPIGHVLAHRFPHLRSGTRQYLIYSLDVESKSRRRGVGSRLLAAVLAMAQAEQAESFVFTNASNIAAMRLYQAAGAVRNQWDDVGLVFPAGRAE